jgi:CRISPR-associated protein Cas1
MSWRTVVIRERSKLDLRLGFLEIRRVNETKKIYISEIAVLIIESTAVSLTAALLSELIKQKIKVIFCDEKRNPQSELMPYFGSHDTSAKIRSQINWDENAADAVWTEIVREKIGKQAQLLKIVGCNEYLTLTEYKNQIEFADATNREGLAAKIYFNALFGGGFSRTHDVPINAALNYGYSILLSAFNREVCKNGYLTQIGIFHDSMFNCFNLSSDLMEPFRPLADRAVYEMNPVKFEWEEKERMINILNEEIVMDGRKQHCINAIEIYVKSVFAAIEDNDISLIKFYEL